MHNIPGLTTNLHKTGETYLGSAQIPCLFFTLGFIAVFTGTQQVRNPV
jgi:hypothetical protein